MKTTPYTRMRQAIVGDLSNYSADAIYNNIYPMFNHNGDSINGNIKYLFNIIENNITEKNEENLIHKFKEQFYDDTKHLRLSKKEQDIIFSNKEKDLRHVFEFILASKHLLLKINSIFDHEFFIEAKYDKQYIEKVDFKTISQELLTVLNATIPAPKVFNIIKSTGEDFPKEAVVIENNNKSKLPFDDIAPINFSLKKALQRGEIAISESGKIFLNYGNGIYAKILARKNNHKIEPVFCLIQENNSFYKDKETSSGFRINNGLYIVSNKYIFEIYFNAHAFLQ